MECLGDSIKQQRMEKIQMFDRDKRDKFSTIQIFDTANFRNANVQITNVQKYKSSTGTNFRQYKYSTRQMSEMKMFKLQMFKNTKVRQGQLFYHTKYQKYRWSKYKCSKRLS